MRRRMIVGLGLVALLILLAILVMFWQLNTLRNATQDAREQNDRLALALDIAYQETQMLAVVQEKAAERIPAIFIKEVGATIRALETRRDELCHQLPLLPVGDPMRDCIERASESLQDTINMAAGTIRDAEGENWPAVHAGAAALLEHHNDVGWRLYQLVTLTHDRRVQAEARANEAMTRMVLVSVPLVMVALVIAATVVFVAVRGITVGVEQLSRSAQRLAEGHFEERIPVARKDELGRLADSFNRMAEELQRLYSGLEQQVAARTADLERRSTQLETAAQVAREAAAIQDVGRLLDTTVHHISERFGFYHAGLFLVDEAGESAVLQVASSEGGRHMLARGHKLKVGEEGIVGYVAATGDSRIALDVEADAVFLNNPDLPGTRSEVALPLKVRGQVIGVLDIQSTQESAFSEENVAILQTMADQVALAIANARLLEESQSALRELETLYGRRVREIWQERQARQPAAYRYTGVGVEAVAPSFALESGGAGAASEGQARLVAPIRLREQTIGSIVLQRDADQNPWSAEEVSLVEELSTQIALALENAHLLEETQRRAEQEQILGQMTARFTRSLDMDTLLQTAVRELGQLLQVDEVSVHIGPPPDRVRNAD
ncbi:MAG TPA: GAF domain-containing protein [Anaerolineae bacterium]|nr:GAF domain-containing protein [Anaerolineae bacterium]